MGKMDEIQIEVLADGTIKVTTDPISPANHMNADQLINFLHRLTGGEQTKTKRTDVHRHGEHSHSHSHDHGHEHHH